MPADYPGESRRTGSARRRLDPQSRSYLRLFVLHIGILVGLNLPSLVMISSQPRATLSRLMLLFGVTAGALALLAVQQRQRFLSPGLNLWDEAAAFLALGCACSVALGTVS